MLPKNPLLSPKLNHQTQLHLISFAFHLTINSSRRNNHENIEVVVCSVKQKSRINRIEAEFSKTREGKPKRKNRKVNSPLAMQCKRSKQTDTDFTRYPSEQKLRGPGHTFLLQKTHSMSCRASNRLRTSHAPTPHSHLHHHPLLLLSSSQP